MTSISVLSPLSIRGASFRNRIIMSPMVTNYAGRGGEVSEKLGRGRHTTRHVELFPLPGGGYVADTPGFSSLDLEKSELVLKDELPDAFPEFADYLGKCKFTSCSHTGEKGCAVGAAVEAGKIAPERYESYKALYAEVKDIKDWQLGK